MESPWQYSTVHNRACKVIEEQTLWGQTVCRVWLPNQDAVVRVPRSALQPLASRSSSLTTDHMAHVAAAAKVAEVLEGSTSATDGHVLLAPMESNVIPLPHQIHALSRAISGDRVRYLLADEVGLGKVSDLISPSPRHLIRRPIIVMKGSSGTRGALPPDEGDQVMNVLAVIIVGGLAFSVLVTAGLLAWLLKQSKQALQPLFGAWGDRVKYKISTACTYIVVERDGLLFSVGHTPAQKATPPRLYVILNVPQRFTAAFRKRNAADRFFETLGLCRPLDISDAAFVDCVQTSAPDSQTAMDIFGDLEMRTTIRLLLLENNVSNIWMNRDGIALIVNLEIGQQVEPAETECFMDVLVQLSQPALSAFARQPHRKAKMHTSPPEPLLTWLGSPLVVMIFIGAMSWIIGVESYPPLFPIFADVIQRTWMFMATGIVLTLGGMWMMTHRRTDRHVYMVILGALSLFSWFLVVCGSVYFLNGFSARNERATTKKAEVARVFIKGRGGKKISFYVNGHETGDLDRPSGNPRPGDLFDLHVKPGFFSYDWIDDMTPTAATIQGDREENEPRH